MKSIEFIKDEFSKANPILYTYKGHPEVSLVSKDMNTATDITLTTAINECSQLTFSVPFTKDRKLDNSSVEKLIYFSGIYFIIKEIVIEDSSTKTIKVTATEISTSLKGILCEEISQIGATAQTIFNAIISATKFTDIGFEWLGTDVPDTTLRHLIADSGVSAYENLVSLASVFNGSIEFSYSKEGIGYVYLRTKYIASHKFIKKDIDLKSLTVTFKSDQIFTKIFPTGYTDEYGIVLDIQDVNDGQSILSDYSYYKSIGIPDDIIARDPQYQQYKTLQDDTYTDSASLLTYAKEELSKCCKPQIEADVEISDLAIYIDSPIETPKINMLLKVIDKSVGYVFDCQITGVERNYNNPFDIKLTVSNIINYSTAIQSLQYSSNIVNSVVSTTNGTPTVNTNYLSGTIDALKTSLIGTVDLTTPESSQSTLAILFEDKRIGYPTYGAMGFGTKGLCIANSLKVDGTWDWKTFGDVNGFNASLIKTGILKDLDEQTWVNMNNGDFSFLNNKLYSENGVIKVPTQALNTKDKQIANTEFVTNAIANLVNSAPSTLDTLNELANALGDDPNFATTVTNTLALKTNNTDETRTTNDKTVTGAINELNARQNIVVDTITSAIAVGTGNITITISGLGTNPIVVTNGDYELNTAQILGVKNINVDTIIIYYSNGIDGNCKFNFIYEIQ